MMMFFREFSICLHDDRHFVGCPGPQFFRPFFSTCFSARSPQISTRLINGKRICQLQFQAMDILQQIQLKDFLVLIQQGDIRLCSIISAQAKVSVLKLQINGAQDLMSHVIVEFQCSQSNILYETVVERSSTEISMKFVTVQSQLWLESCASSFNFNPCNVLLVRLITITSLS